MNYRFEIPKSEWVKFFEELSNNNRGRMVRMWLESDELGKKKLAENFLITFEGDCAGDMVDLVKIIVGDMEGPDPEAVYHNVPYPLLVEIENDENGKAKKLVLEDNEKQKTILEFDPTSI